MITPKHHYAFSVEQLPSPNVYVKSIKDKKGEIDPDLDIRNAKYEATIHNHVCVIP